MCSVPSKLKGVFFMTSSVLSNYNNEIISCYNELIARYDQGKGYVSNKSLEKLTRFNALDLIEEFNEIRRKYAETELKTEIDKWFGQIKRAYNYGNGYIYEKGVDELKKLNAEKELKAVAVMRKYLATSAKEKKKDASESLEKEFECAEPVVAQLSVNKVVVRDNHAYVIQQITKHGNGGIAKGLVSNVWYSIKAQDISNTPIGTKILEKHKAENDLKKKEMKKLSQNRLVRQKLFNTIADDQFIERCRFDELLKDKTVLWNSFNENGGGDMLIYDHNYAYLIINNSGKSDCQSLSTIKIPGKKKGAYGFFTDYEKVKDLLAMYIN